MIKPLDQPISVGETVHIKLEVGTDKVFKVYVRDMETPKITMPAYEKYNGGYVGFASCATAAKFENIQFTDNTPTVRLSAPLLLLILSMTQM